MDASLKAKLFDSFKKGVTPELIKNWLGIYSQVEILRIVLKPMFEVNMTDETRHELKVMVLETLNAVFEKLDRQRIGEEILQQIIDL